MGTNEKVISLDLDDKTAEFLGKQIVELLGLKMNRDGKYKTSWGDKTVVGLGQSIANHFRGSIAYRYGIDKYGECNWTKLVEPKYKPFQRSEELS